MLTKKQNFVNTLGVDYGTSYVGLAICQSPVFIAYPYQTLENKSEEYILKVIKDIVLEKSIQKIVIGLPISMSGHKTEQTRKTELFINSLKNHINIPIEVFDERLSSKQAIAVTDYYQFQSGRRLNKTKKDVQEHAQVAAIILQTYLGRELAISKKN